MKINKVYGKYINNVLFKILYSLIMEFADRGDLYAEIVRY